MREGLLHKMQVKRNDPRGNIYWSTDVGLQFRPSNAMNSFGLHENRNCGSFLVFSEEA